MTRSLRFSALCHSLPYLFSRPLLPIGAQHLSAPRAHTLVSLRINERGSGGPAVALSVSKHRLPKRAIELGDHLAPSIEPSRLPRARRASTSASRHASLTLFVPNMAKNGTSGALLRAALGLGVRSGLQANAACTLILAGIGMRRGEHFCSSQADHTRRLKRIKRMSRHSHHFAAAARTTPGARL